MQHGFVLCALGLLLFCGCSTPAPPAQGSAEAAAAEPRTGEIVAVCDDYRRQVTETDEGAGSASNESAPRRGWPVHLPGMAALPMRAAPPAVTSALLGPHCPGDDKLWTLGVDRLSGDLRPIEQTVLAVSTPSLVTLNNGRAAFIGFASEGRYHAADGFGVVAIIDERAPAPTTLFAMPGGAAWGETPVLNAPREQPPGAWHVWSAAGDISFGDAHGWAAVTDLAGAAPRALGRFRTYGRHLCAAEGEACRGGWEYVVTSIAYARSGQLSLRWHREDFDQPAGGDWRDPRKTRSRFRDLSAVYELREGRYRLVQGREPPEIP